MKQRYLDNSRKETYVGGDPIIFESSLDGTQYDRRLSALDDQDYATSQMNSRYQKSFIDSQIHRDSAKEPLDSQVENKL